MTSMTLDSAPVSQVSAKPLGKPSLEAVRLEKSFLSGVVQVHVLQGLSVSLYPGELSLISGPSGCGKSTL